MMTKRNERLIVQSPKIVLALAVLFFLLLLNSAEISAAVPKVKVLIMFTEQPGPAEQALVRGFGGEIKYTYSLLPTIAASIPEKALAGLSNNPRIALIEPDGIAHLTDSELDAAWGVKRIGAGQVHAGGNRGAGVKIGILDSGIDLNHPDLSYDSSCSFNFVETETLDDGHSHGTHVAGIIAALDNDTGVVGVAPEATLCIYKVFDSNGDATYGDIIAAIDRAVIDGVDITNNSWGDNNDPGINVYTAFHNAYAAGVLHVAGAGNNGNFFGLSDNCMYPALWDMVMATAGTTSNDSIDPWSSTCQELELSAPGKQVYSTMPGGGYGNKSGTSMASPHVAGTAALVLAANPGWSNDAIRNQLQVTADYLGEHKLYGYGLVDADEAATGPVNIPPVADNQTVSTSEDSPVGIILSGSDPDNDPITFNIVSGPFNGAISGVPPNLTYLPYEDYYGDDSFNFVADDGLITSNEATVTITIIPVNDAPVANDDNAETAEEIAVSIDVLVNDMDVDGDLLMVTGLTQPGNGITSINEDGTINYTPNSGFSGSDVFTYRAYDGFVESEAAYVYVDITPANEAPIAGDDFYGAVEDNALVIGTPGVLAGDSDGDGDSLTAVLVDDVAHGVLALNSDGSFTFTPEINFNGDDIFRYRANDGLADSNVATVTIIVASVNDAPVADFAYTCTALSCDLDATPSDDVDGTITNYYWDFGDTLMGSGATASHAYSEAGTYSVMLTVIDDEGASASFSQDITVTETRPTLHVAGLAVSRITSGPWNRGQVEVTVVDQSDSPVIGASVAGEFTLLIQAPPESEQVGGVTGGTGQAVFTSSKTRTAGEWQFCVTSLVADGYVYEEPRTCDTSDGGTPVNQPPSADFSYNTNLLAVTFTDLSDDSDGIIASWYWDFGDGSTGTAQSPVYSYPGNGTYNVTLTVTDDSGDTGSLTKQVQVSDGTNPIISLGVTSAKVRGVYQADLVWSGASQAPINIYRDGNLLESTENDGLYTDILGKKPSGSYTYQVCEVESGVCSNEANLVFE